LPTYEIGDSCPGTPKEGADKTCYSDGGLGYFNFNCDDGTYNLYSDNTCATLTSSGNTFFSPNCNCVNIGGDRYLQINCLGEECTDSPCPPVDVCPTETQTVTTTKPSTTKPPTTKPPTATTTKPTTTPIRKGTKTSLSINANVTKYSRPLTLTAAVTPVPVGGPLPTGHVLFTYGTKNTLLCRSAVISGKATCLTTKLDADDYNAVASYEADSSFLGSKSSAVTFRVNKVATTTKVVIKQFLPHLSLQILVTPSKGVNIKPSGQVTLKIGNKITTNVKITNGVGVYSNEALTKKSYSIQATFLGTKKF
jgi:hypothetical protein